MCSAPRWKIARGSSNSLALVASSSSSSSSPPPVAFCGGGVGTCCCLQASQSLVWSTDLPALMAERRASSRSLSLRGSTPLAWMTRSSEYSTSRGVPGNAYKKKKWKKSEWVWWWVIYITQVPHMADLGVGVAVAPTLFPYKLGEIFKPPPRGWHKEGAVGGVCGGRSCRCGCRWWRWRRLAVVVAAAAARAGAAAVAVWAPCSGPGGVAVSVVVVVVVH